MKVSLPSGAEADIKLFYDEFKDTYFDKVEKKEKERTRRRTNLNVKIVQHDEEVELAGTALCSEDDPFEKVEGKRWAFRRAMEGDPNRELLSRDDRKFIFRTICPAFFG